MHSVNEICCVYIVPELLIRSEIRFHESHTNITRFVHLHFAYEELSRNMSSDCHHRNAITPVMQYALEYCYRFLARACMFFCLFTERPQIYNRDRPLSCVRTPDRMAVRYICLQYVFVYPCVLLMISFRDSAECPRTNTMHPQFRIWYMRVQEHNNRIVYRTPHPHPRTMAIKHRVRW